MYKANICSVDRAVLRDYTSFSFAFILEFTLTQCKIEKEWILEDANSMVPNWTAEIGRSLLHRLSSTHPDEPKKWRRGNSQPTIWMNDEHPSPPNSCSNNVTAPIPQSLIRGSSLVALLPLNIRHARQNSSERIKEQRKCLDSWLLWIISGRHSFLLFSFVWSFFSSSSHKHVTKEIIFSLSLQVFIYTALGCKLMETKALFLFGLPEPFAVLAACVFPFNWPSPTRKRDTECRTKWIKVSEDYCTFPSLFAHLFSSIKFKDNSGIKQAQKRIQSMNILPCRVTGWQFVGARLANLCKMAHRWPGFVRPVSDRMRYFSCMSLANHDAVAPVARQPKWKPGRK